MCLAPVQMVLSLALIKTDERQKAALESQRLDGNNHLHNIMYIVFHSIVMLECKLNLCSSLCVNAGRSAVA